MNSSELIERYLNLMVSEGFYRSKGNLKSYLNYLFKGISFIDKSMLDVGGGSGLFSLCARCMSAQPVICLEPESSGSAKRVSNKFRQYADHLNLDNIYLEASTFQNYEPGGASFDIILLHNSINHLSEEACINLKVSAEARKEYEAIFAKMSQVAKPGAKLIITDCSRYNFFALLRLKNPLAPNINWHKHQSPQFWSSMLKDAGFANPHIRWSFFPRLGIIDRFLLGNRLVSFFLISHFCLVMEKCQESA